MQAYRTETRIEETGRLSLSHLPFRVGEEVEVIVLPRSARPAPENRYPLRGKPFRYDRPTDPVAEDDWEVLE